MAYGKIDGERKILSQVLAAKDDLHGRVGMEFQTAAVELEGSGDVAPMGLLVGYTGTGWAVIDGGTDIEDFDGEGAPLVKSDLGVRVAVVVGGSQGVGFNQEDVDSNGGLVTVLYKGDAAVIKDGLEFGSVDTNVADIIEELQGQGIKVVDAATQPVITLA